MAFETLLYERRGPVATITLNRPDKRNYLDARMGGEFIQAARQAGADPESRVLVVTGAGDVFCAGGDIKAFAAARPMEQRDGVGYVREMIMTLLSLRLPTIARVQGPALGGGAGLVSMCDFAIASEDALMGYPEMNLGLIPAMVAVLLQRTIGRRAAADLLFTGRIVKGREAAALGLVNDAVPRAGLDDRVATLAATLAEKSPVAVRQLKALFYLQGDLSLERALDAGIDKFVGLSASEDMKEGIAAFLENRKPNFTGR